MSLIPPVALFTFPALATEKPARSPVASPGNVTEVAVEGVTTLFAPMLWGMLLSKIA